MANFLLAWELRDVNSNVEVEIVNVDSLAPNVVWPENVDASMLCILSRVVFANIEK